MKKMIYLGHNYHLKTKSNQFLFELFKQEYDISFVSYDPYEKKYVGLEEAQKQKYDVLLTWQLMPMMSFLTSNFTFRQGVVFPMYDFVITRPYDPWPQYRGFKIINFCRKMHDELIKRGYDSHYIQYFPQPMETANEGDIKSVFFWQRMEQINIHVVQKLFADKDIEHIHIHKAMDPEQKFTEPDEDIKKKVDYSEWLSSVSDVHSLMEKSAYYIAPRLYEGIGMSFLEAMAMGRCVIAPDTPTVNEYITNGVNGILYDLADVKPFSAADIRSIQKNAKDTIVQGYQRWEQEKANILKWMQEDKENPLVTVVTVVKNAIQGGREQSIIQCIESVHNQRYPHIEHLVVDGQSDDGTLNILYQFERLGWITFVSETDNGMYEAMNKGILRAKGKYLVFLNSDDYFHNPYAVWESVFSLENSGADFSFASNRILRQDGICEVIRKPQIGSFVAHMPFCHQTMFTKKSTLLKIGMFNENYKSSADYDLILRLMLAGCRYVEVETDIVTYRNGGVSESMQKRSDLEKYDIFQKLYAPYYEEVSEQFARRLAGRICPMQFLDCLKTHMSQDLRKEVEHAVVRTDEQKQICYFPLEILVPYETDSISEGFRRI